MKMTMISLSVAVLIAGLARPAFAAVSEPEPAPAAPAQCDITFSTGQAGKGYSKYYANFHDVCPQVPTCEKNTEGALDNIGDLITKAGDIGFTDVYTLQNMLGADDQYKQLQVVASLHSNLMHVLTLASGFDIPGPLVDGPPVKNPKYSKYNPLDKEPEMIPGPKVPGPVTHLDIGKFSELKGKPVGLVGSAQFIVRKLNATSGHGMQFTDFSDDAKAIAALKKGDVQAVITMAAWPHGVIDKFKTDSGLRLVDYDLQATAPLFVTKRGYKGLGQYSVTFLGTPNILVTRPFTVGGENARIVAAVKNCIAANLTKLKDGKGKDNKPMEPAWSEVNDLNQTYGLPAFQMPGAAPKKK
jgi:TRAP-type uncharacterized transport system substrate-binding protein